MAQAAAAAHDNILIQAAEQGSGDALKDAQRNALGKQYNMHLQFTVVETQNNKPFFNSGPVERSGVPYPIVVATEKLLVDLLAKFVELGAAVAQGERPA